MSDNGNDTPIILLADDEEVIRMMGRDILRVLGYEVMLASNGNEAIDTYRNNQAKIDLILLDWHMPGLKGPEILEQLWEIDASAKVILATGWGPPRELEEFKSQGRDIGLLQKPYLVKDLQKEIAEFLAK
ncbi:response regulator [bacterium]|nr:response regulator [bacterium]MBU1652536.1 response regulator [bacterium]